MVGGWGVKKRKKKVITMELVIENKTQLPQNLDARTNSFFSFLAASRGAHEEELSPNTKVRLNSMQHPKTRTTTSTNLSAPPRQCSHTQPPFVCQQQPDRRRYSP
jgi:hypothetical protein